MKKIIIASSVIIASLGIVACSSNASPAPTVTVTQNAPAPSLDDPATPEVASSDEDLYLLGIKSMNNPILNVATDAQLLEMGHSVCEALNAGFTTDDVIQYMATQMAGNGMTSDVEVEAVGYIIGAADSALCPSTF